MKDNFKFVLSERVLEAAGDEKDGMFIYTANREDELYRITWVDEDDVEDCGSYYSFEEVKICLEDKDWIIVEDGKEV